MQSINRLLVFCAAAAIVCGCASNGFEKFYTPTPGADKVLASPQLIPPPATPQVFNHGSDLSADAKAQWQHGYVLIGTSSFFGPANKTNQSQAVEQAKKVHASVVLIQSKYMDTLNRSVPLTLPNPNQVSTVNTTGTVNTYGSGGYGSGSYNATSTITSPGGYTTYQMPYSITRNNFFASYWVRMDVNKMRLGVRYNPLSDALRKSLQRNTGIVVYAVIQGTPAFKANVLEGDVIFGINGEDVVDVTGFDSQLGKFAGQPVELQIMRGDEPKKINVTLNTGS